MKSFAKVYFWYHSMLTEVLRGVFLLFLISLILVGVLYNIYPNIFITLFGLFLIFEIYFSQKIAKTVPKSEVGENSGDIFDSFTLETMAVFETQNDSKNLIKHLMHIPQVKFIIAKADAQNEEINFLDIDKNQLANAGFNIAKKMGGKYVTTMDLFVGYLILTEPTTKFLFNKKLKQEDIENLLLWSKNVYQTEEASKKAHVSFAGEGIAEDWIYGWTIETSKYMMDLSREFINDKEPVGRQNEYKQMTEALHKGSSVILVGDAGSGKESVVKQLAIESFMGNLDGNLLHQKILQLMVDAFMAGAKTQGEIEERVNAVVGELAHSGNVIVYVPEFQNVLGSDSFHLDISGALIPYVNKGQIRIIAAVTPGAYKSFVEPMHTLLDGFTVVSFPEPSKEEVLNMLFIKSPEIEARNKVILSYKSILKAYEFAKNYAKEKVLPGAAVVLLEDSANSVSLAHKKIISEQDILDQVKKVTHVEVGEPKQVEKGLLLNLENEIHKRVINQSEAVTAIAEAIRRVRAGLKSPKKPISFLFLGPTGVGKTETAKALAEVYFGNTNRFIRLDMSEFSGGDGTKRLLGSPPGQGDEKGQLTEAVYDNPYSLILLDEFEKADPKILDLFLQVFDDGRLTDNKGKTVSFVNSIIIATSNAASEYIREEVGKGAVIDKKFNSQLLEFLQTKGIFKPELLNRFDDIIVFKPLGQNEIIQIVKLLLVEFSKTMQEKEIGLVFDERVIAKIAQEGFDKDFGARPLKRFIADNLEDIFAQKMLKDEIKRGDRVTVTLDTKSSIILIKA
ncbi:MAG: hypothetical protein COU25_02445 [Candidatus Levybacteria bacterium CG10_big_fil_rev_8_21_14_0_10_35_13]|nr:MAG: hypothetical protein COU25_02445 [Candidatus Levybacteria bacterium CG10_big_fil_rev_8_21_14_0_10_35_13]